MTVIKNFLPENTDKKIYAVMPVSSFMELSINEALKPDDYSKANGEVKILLNEAVLYNDHKVIFKFKMHMENRGNGDYTLPLSYDEIKAMAAGEGMGIKFIGYTDEKPAEFMQELEQAIQK